MKWCITRALNPIKTHSERITDKLRMQSNDLKWGDYNLNIYERINYLEKHNDISINL